MRKNEDRVGKLERASGESLAITQINFKITEINDKIVRGISDRSEENPKIKGIFDQTNLVFRANKF